MTAIPILRNVRVGVQRRSLTAPDGSANSAVRAAQEPSSKQTAPDASHASGFAAGHADGVRQGLADAQSRIDRELETRWKAAQLQLEETQRRRADEHVLRIAALESTLQTLQKALPERFMSLERQAVELAFEALCRVCGPQTDRAGLLADLVRQGIDQLRGHALLAIRLHPEDQAALAASDAGRVLMDRYAEVRWIADPAVEQAGCLLESDFGHLDAGLATQLSRLRQLWSQARAPQERGPA